MSTQRPASPVGRSQEPCPAACSCHVTGHRPLGHEAFLPSPDEGFDFPVTCRMAAVPRPWQLNKMTFARQTCFCADVGVPMMASSRVRSAAVTSNVIPVRIHNRRIIRTACESNGESFCRDRSTIRVQRYVFRPSHFPWQRPLFAGPSGHRARTEKRQFRLRSRL